MRGRFAGFALLLSVVLLGAFISGCINQSVQTETTSRPTETVTETKTETETTTSTETKTETETESPITDTKTPTDTETKTETETKTQTPTETPTETPAKGLWGNMTEEEVEKWLEEMVSIIEFYNDDIEYSKGLLEKLGASLDTMMQSPGIVTPDDEFAALMELAENTDNKTLKLGYLINASLIRFRQAMAMRNLVTAVAVEKSYWDAFSEGAPLEEYYRDNSGRPVLSMVFEVHSDAVFTQQLTGEEMAEATKKLIGNKEVVGVHIIQPSSDLGAIIGEGRRDIEQRAVPSIVLSRDRPTTFRVTTPSGKVIIKDIKKKFNIMEFSPQEPVKVDFEVGGIYTVDGVNGCILIPPENPFEVILTPAPPFNPCPYPTESTFFVVDNYTEPTKLSEEEVAKLSATGVFGPECWSCNVIGVPPGTYQIATKDFNTAIVVDPRTGEIIHRADMSRGSFELPPLDGEAVLYIPYAKGNTCRRILPEVSEDAVYIKFEAVRSDCGYPPDDWLIPDPENMLVVEPEKGEPWETKDIPPYIVYRQPQEGYLEPGNYSVIAINVTVTPETVVVEEVIPTQTFAVGPGKTIEDLLKPSPTFPDPQRVSGKFENAPWGYPMERRDSILAPASDFGSLGMVYNDTIGSPGPYNPIEIPPLMINESIGSPGPYDPFGPSRVGPITIEIKIVIKLGKSTMMGSEQPEVLITISEEDIHNGTNKMINPYYIPHFSLDRLIIEVLTLRDPKTGEDSQAAFVKLIGIDGKFDARSTLSLAGSPKYGILDWPGITINEEEKHK